MSFTLGALKSCEGDQQAADYLLNCKVPEYYWRLANRNRFVDWHNERTKVKP